ncbi:MAG TPA: HEAT repeat domain-containing protein [Bryobacteraceae bacterium]
MTKLLLLAIGMAAMALAQTSAHLRLQSQAALQDALDSGNPNTRKQAVIALSLAASRGPFLSKLESMIADKDVEVRLAAVASMEDLRSKQTIATLRQALNGEVPEVSFAAAKALYELGDPAGKQALLSVLSGDTKTSSGFLTKQMREAMRMMHTPRATFIFALRQGIGFAPVPGLGVGITSLQQLLSDPGVSGRASAALLLSRDPRRDTLQALRRALSDRDWSVRAAAVHALALRNNPALQPDIARLVNDDNQAVRLRAAAAYIRFDAIKRDARARRHRQTTSAPRK